MWVWIYLKINAIQIAYQWKFDIFYGYYYLVIYCAMLCVNCLTPYTIFYSIHCGLWVFYFFLQILLASSIVNYLQFKCVSKGNEKINWVVDIWLFGWPTYEKAKILSLYWWINRYFFFHHINGGKCNVDEFELWCTYMYSSSEQLHNTRSQLDEWMPSGPILLLITT